MVAAPIKTVIDFEGIASAGHDAVLLGQYGLTWQGVGAIDKDELTKHDPDGYNAVLRGHGVGVTSGDADFKSETTTFTLKGGHFAAAWSTGLTVTFTAYTGAHVFAGSETFILGQTDTFLSFDKHFRHINEVSIATSGGTPGTGTNHFGPQIPDIGASTALAMDSLKLVFDASSDRLPPSPSHLEHDLTMDAHASAAIVPIHDWV